jgi:V/A-type H+-transporting ATPase subunit D
MLTDVSPTRMELLKLRKKLVIAKRGHKLLKDKLDELVRIMIALVNEGGGLRERSDMELLQSMRLMNFAGAASFPESVAAALHEADKPLEIEIVMAPLLNLRIPRFEFKEEPETQIISGAAQTSAALDESAEVFSSALKMLLELAAKEKEIRMVADEMEKTRRRVNALEYILIPGITEKIKFISMKIEETERNTMVRLMRIKDIVRAPRSHASRIPAHLKWAG